MQGWENQLKNLLYLVLGLLILWFLLTRPVPQALSQKDDSALTIHGLAPPVQISVPLLPGIDVSHFQGRVSWPAVQSAGVRFAYLKATEGVTYTDPRFAQNLRALAKLDLPNGAYHFFEPHDDPIDQARHFLSTANIGKGSLPPVLDIEITKQRPPHEISAAALRWLEFVERESGCTPIIYTYRAYWERNLGDEFLAYPLWLADYAGEPAVPKGVERWRFWQHSEKGRIGGIAMSVDLDWFNGDEKSLASVTC